MKVEKQVTSGQLDFTFTRRAVFVGGVQAAIGATVAARMSYIAVADNEKYKLLAESNRVNLTIIPPRRGWFIDRYGKPIATNRADFRVDIIPDRLVRKEETIATLANLLALSSDDVDRINRELKQAQGFQPVQVADGLDYERFAAVSVRLPRFARRQPAPRLFPLLSQRCCSRPSHRLCRHRFRRRISEEQKPPAHHPGLQSRQRRP